MLGAPWWLLCVVAEPLVATSLPLFWKSSIVIGGATLVSWTTESWCVSLMGTTVWATEG